MYTNAPKLLVDHNGTVSLNGHITQTSLLLAGDTTQQQCSSANLEINISTE